MYQTLYHIMKYHIQEDPVTRGGKQMNILMNYNQMVLTDIKYQFMKNISIYCRDINSCLDIL